MHDDMSNRV